MIKYELTYELGRTPTMLEYAKKLEEIQDIKIVWDEYDEAVDISLNIDSDTYNLSSNISDIEDLPEYYIKKFSNAEEALEKYNENLEILEESDIIISEILNK